MEERGIGRIGLRLYLTLVVGFMLLPLVFIMTDSLNAAEFRGAPFNGLTLRWYERVFSEPLFASGFRNSLVVAAGASALAVSFGTLASLGLVRFRFRGRDLLRSLFLSPIVFPRVALGLGAYILFLKVASGLGLREWILGSVVPMTIVHSLLGLPIVVLLVSAALLGLDPSVEEAAQDLGATPRQTLFKVTAPLIRGSLIMAGVFAFMFSFDEVETSFFLAPLGAKTLPIEMFLFLERDLTPTLAALSTLLVIGTLLLVFVVGVTQGLGRLTRLAARE